MLDSDSQPKMMDLRTVSQVLQNEGVPLNKRVLQQACRDRKLRCCRCSKGRGKWFTSITYARTFATREIQYNLAPQRSGPLMSTILKRVLEEVGDPSHHREPE
jgi:hypothetical protein